MNSKSIKLLKA